MVEVEVDDLCCMGLVEGGDIGDGVLFIGQLGLFGQVLVEGGENFFGELLIVFDGWWVLFFGEDFEMYVLVEDGVYVGSMESQLGQGFLVFLGGVGK